MHDLEWTTFSLKEPDHPIDVSRIHTPWKCDVGLPGQRARRNPALRRKRMPFRKRSDQRFTVDVLND